MRGFLLLFLMIAVAQGPYAAIYSGGLKELAGNPVNSGQVQLSADRYCAHSGVYDQTCLANALKLAGPNSHILLSPHPYLFTAKLTVSGITNVTIEAKGATVMMDGLLFECDACSNVHIVGIGISSVTIPTIVAVSSLPTGDASQVIAIDRFGAGSGYIPTVNDGDLRTSADGGGCTTKCLSHAQANEAFDTGLDFENGNGIEISGTLGRWASLTCNSCTNANFHDNTMTGGGKNNSWGILSFGGTSLNHDVRVANNQITAAAFSGISFRNVAGASVTSNHVSYNGESGIKTGQGSGNYVTHLTSSSNTSDHNFYDGIDYSEDYPHKGTTACYCSSTGDVSSYNHGTGFYVDGQHWTFRNERADHNANTGFSATLAYSSIAGIVASANNTALTSSGVHQIIMQPGVGVSVTGATVQMPPGTPGYGMYVVDAASQTYSGNTVPGGIFYAAGNSHGEINQAPAKPPVPNRQP